MCFDGRIEWRDQDAYWLDIANIFKKAPVVRIREANKKIDDAKDVSSKTC